MRSPLVARSLARAGVDRGAMGSDDRFEMLAWRRLSPGSLSDAAHRRFSASTVVNVLLLPDTQKNTSRY
jgi:hypothetical protein